MKMKKIGKYILVMTIISLFMSSCDQPKKFKSTADQMLQKETEKSMIEANRQVGMPAIINFQEKKTMKTIYELRDQEDMICYAYLTSLDGSIGQFLGKCIGYGLPYSTQFSNPMKYGEVDGGEMGARNPYTMPQPEPNGLFMPEGLSATWLLLIDPESKKPRPVYIEPQIIVSPFKLHK